MLSCYKNEQVREELLKNLEDFMKLVKKRGSFGACFLPDAFGHIVCFKNWKYNDEEHESCIFATNDYCYYIVYQTIEQWNDCLYEPEPSNIWGGEGEL